MIHAFCNVALAPIRAENSDKSEMISQILFGEGLEILEIKENWSYIKCVYDNYEGWVDSKQYKITKNLVSADFLSFHLSHACQFDSLSFPLVLGSRLPNFDGINFTIEKEKYIYNGKAIDSKKNAISNLQKLALKYINAPYLWGGKSPYGIDCSGYTQMVFSFFNIVLPRDAYLQANLGETINFVGEARVGDLAFLGRKKKLHM